MYGGKLSKTNETRKATFHLTSHQHKKLVRVHSTFKDVHSGPGAKGSKSPPAPLRVPSSGGGRPIAQASPLLMYSVTM